MKENGKYSFDIFGVASKNQVVSLNGVSLTMVDKELASGQAMNQL
jgi:hypothetical protein